MRDNHIKHKYQWRSDPTG